MEDGRHIIDDVQLWARGHDTNRSRDVIAAGAGLSELHRDMPEIVGLGSGILKQMDIDAGASRTMSRRLADASVREIVHAGAGRLDQQQRYEVVRRALRNVLIQEAAGHEITRRGGVDPVRALDREQDRGQHGVKATAALRRIGVDVDTLMGSMTEHDLGRTSQGAYDRVSTIAHAPLVKALEAEGRIMSDSQVEMNRRINAEVERPGIMSHPVRHLARHVPPRQATFGRRMAQTQAHAHQMAAGAGR